ncbi:MULTISPECIES: type II secretion system F family protein [Hydrogenophaga]|uniref:Type II secretion system protein n=1 Tax=Hydrogenophaga electricum TaxID=1230953 RepID=A0ABQ6C7G8_9BURK|nr:MULTISPECIES: type II secretion system F family protein [Hydrogenophaga]GLS15965.1 type II secretion system protein [Hydrogenophaga electricum]
MGTVRTYFYRVLLPHGEVRSGFLRLLVERDHSVRVRLEQETEGTVLSLMRLPTWLTAINDFRLRTFRSQVRSQDLAGFLRDLGIMLDAGVPMMDALKTLIEDDTGYRGVAGIARRVHADIGSGMRVPQSFSRHPDVFPETVRNLAEIGDESGTLPRMLLESASHVERLIDIHRDIRTAMIYPTLVFASILGVGFFWLYYVVPNLAQLFKQLQAKLPPLTQWLINVSDVLVHYMVLVAVGFVVLVVLLLWLFRSVPRFRRACYELMHRLPVVRTLLTSSGMAFISEHLSLLVRAGLDFMMSLDVLARATSNQYYRDRLMRVREGVARGEGIGASMRRVGGFPAMAVRMISVGEESGSLDKQLDRLAAEYRKRLDVVVQSLSEIIKPALILIAGGLFIFLIVALLLPIYDLVRQSVGQTLGVG